MYGNPGGAIVGGGTLLAMTGSEISAGLLVAATLALVVGSLCLIRTRMVRRAQAD